MLKIIAIIVGVAVIAVLAYAASRPNSFHVARSIVIKAPPEKIYGLIEDFHHWRAWSPYEALDPTMSRTYGGPSRGLGSTYAWESRGKAGAGRMEIARIAAPSALDIDLAFTKPMRANNKALFTLTPEGDGTRVTWAMEGASSFLFKLMGLVFNMDKMIGTDFETGLASLKAEAEK
jgi:uncharacterized protein YndB with AHSA1/START domain